MSMNESLFLWQLVNYPKLHYLKHNKQINIYKIPKAKQ